MMKTLGKFFSNLPPFFPRNGGRPNRGGNTVLENGQLRAAPPDLYHNKYSRLDILDKKSRFRADIFCPLRIKQVLTPVQRFCSAFLIADSKLLCQDAQNIFFWGGKYRATKY